jgi:hypothetical protein
VKLYEQGFTMDAIATQLGENKATISNDLANCLTTKQSKPAKSASNPKGAGRPKDSTKPRKPASRRGTIVEPHDAGTSQGFRERFGSRRE